MLPLHDCNADNASYQESINKSVQPHRWGRGHQNIRSCEQNTTLSVGIVASSVCLNASSRLGTRVVAENEKKNCRHLLWSACGHLPGSRLWHVELWDRVQVSFDSLRFFCSSACTSYDIFCLFDTWCSQSYATKETKSRELRHGLHCLKVLAVSL